MAVYGPHVGFNSNAKNKLAKYTKAELNGLLLIPVGLCSRGDLVARWFQLELA